MTLEISVFPAANPGAADVVVIAIANKHLATDRASFFDIVRADLPPILGLVIITAEFCSGSAALEMFPADKAYCVKSLMQSLLESLVVMSMPLPTSGAVVPLFCEFERDAGKLPVVPLFPVQFAVTADRRHELKIADVVVGAVPVDMMEASAAQNFAVMESPDGGVQTFSLALKIVPAPVVHLTVETLFRFRNDFDIHDPASAKVELFRSNGCSALHVKLPRSTVSIFSVG